uniref:Uncharacterized protein n=1 Tax=viral metagenome TaxID=1070528 RepID=A0A6M3JYM0_9ZZZZ
MIIITETDLKYGFESRFGLLKFMAESSNGQDTDQLTFRDCENVCAKMRVAQSVRAQPIRG